jgi:hypothetical protein
MASLTGVANEALLAAATGVLMGVFAFETED